MAGVEILMSVKHMIIELLLWFYEVLLVILVSSLYSSHILYCNKLLLSLLYFILIHITLFLLEDIISKNQKIKSVCKILLSYLFKVLLNYLFIQ